MSDINETGSEPETLLADTSAGWMPVENVTAGCVITFNTTNGITEAVVIAVSEMDAPFNYCCLVEINGEVRSVLQKQITGVKEEAV
ncbi:hypothetical protein [Erwinia sp. Leaf53]|uniref:hypothetical protein n=1 Tax=Erwinia sp. Leaf53 TaxID=1736225 RepID=UPI0006F480BC|nr:hypothetical protein [Erwinia sp. Leaf53]KQN58003.1 hypothetical protein ASF13_04205 [Erwinia sp. Leaf53]